MDEALPALSPLRRPETLVPLDRRRQDHRLFRAAISGPAPASCGPCPTRRRQSAAASRVAVRQRPPATASAARSGRGPAGGVGEVAWVEEEGLIDRGDGALRRRTGLCLPADRGLAEAARKAGLPADLAMRLARVTVSGAGELARLSPKPPSSSAATSPAPRARPGGAERADGAGRHAAADDRAIAAATRARGSWRARR